MSQPKTISFDTMKRDFPLRKQPRSENEYGKSVTYFGLNDDRN